MHKKISYSAPFVRKLNEEKLIEIINDKENYCDATRSRAKSALSTFDPNFVRTRHLLLD